MPATERVFTELPPSRLYLDTNICLDHLIASRPHHRQALRLFQHLTAHGLTTLYLSSPSWIEFTHVVTSQRFRDGLSLQWQQQYRLADWQQPMVRQAYLRVLLGRLQALLDQFGWSEVAVNTDVRIRALQYVALYNLDGQDSVHLACAAEVGVVDLASFDRDFRRVDGLYLWNDRIYDAGVLGSSP